MRRPDEERDGVPISRDAERPVSNTRRKVFRCGGR